MARAQAACDEHMRHATAHVLEMRAGEGSGVTTAPPAAHSADARFGHVQSVWRALDLLEALAGEEPAGLVELAGRAGLQPSTARRLLSTMAARGYVVQSRRSGGYLLGHRTLELRGPVQRRTARLRRVARPHLERARRVCGETISLAVPVESTSVLWIDEVIGAPPAIPRLGRCLPAHASAAGKALLADARERGFAIEDEELEPGVVAVAAAVTVDRRADRGDRRGRAGRPAARRRARGARRDGEHLRRRARGRPGSRGGPAGGRVGAESGRAVPRQAAVTHPERARRRRAALASRRRRSTAVLRPARNGISKTDAKTRANTIVSGTTRASETTKAGTPGRTRPATIFS